MQKKIYVVGMFDAETCAKVDAAVKAVAGVTNCVSNSDKAQVLVDFEGTSEDAINAAIASTGVEVVG
ncbi:MAG: cation transporter [Treponema sp.]|nr:cation transporter [Treponema sp.]